MNIKMNKRKKNYANTKIYIHTMIQIRTFLHQQKILSQYNVYKGGIKNNNQNKHFHC